MPLTLYSRKGSERVVCERWVGDGETATYWPQVPLTIAALLSHSAGLLNQGFLGPDPSAGSWFSLPRTQTPTNWLQLTQAVCGSGFYNCFFAHLPPMGVAIAPNSTHQGDTLISSTVCTCFLIDGWVEGQYVTCLSICTEEKFRTLLLALLSSTLFRCKWCRRYFWEVAI